MYGHSQQQQRSPLSGGGLQLNSPVPLSHGQSSPASFRLPQESPLSADRIPSGLKSSAPEAQAAAKESKPTLPSSVLISRKPVAMQLESVEELFTNRPANMSEMEQRRLINGPRPIWEPWEITAIGDGGGIDVITPEIQSIMLHYYTSDLCSRKEANWTRDIPDPEHNQIITGPLNSLDHWKTSLDRGVPWHSAFPAPVRQPKAINTVELMFSLPNELMTIDEFIARAPNGVITMEMSVAALQKAFDVRVGHILVDALELSEVRLQLPMAVNLQLYSHCFSPSPSSPFPATSPPPSKLSVGEISWIPRTAPNMHAIHSAVIPSNNTNAVVRNGDSQYDTISAVVLPQTNSSQRKLLYGIHSWSKHPMFQRWIHVPEEVVWKELKSYDVSRTHAPNYYRVPAPNNNPEANDRRDVPEGKFVQFICLDEWQSICNWVALNGETEPPRIESDHAFLQKNFDTYNTANSPTGNVNDQLYFFVPHRVLHYFIQQKFTDDPDPSPQWLMSKDRYFMRIDQPVTLSLNILHTYPKQFLEDRLRKYGQANPSAYVSFHSIVRVMYEDSVSMPPSASL
jgi:hypothetical protein